MGNRDLSKLQPEFRAALEAVLDDMKVAGHPMFLTDGWRDLAEQERLWRQGREAPGKIVTWTRNSWHLLGLAADCAFQAPEPWPDAAIKQGKVTHPGWLLYGEAVRRHGLVWGPDVWRKDAPHCHRKPVGQNYQQAKAAYMKRYGITTKTG